MPMQSRKFLLLARRSPAKPFATNSFTVSLALMPTMGRRRTFARPVGFLAAHRADRPLLPAPMPVTSHWAATPADRCGSPPRSMAWEGCGPHPGGADLPGALAMAPSFDVAGWFANSPGVLRRIGTVLLQGSAVNERATRLVVATDAFAQADAEVTALCLEFLDRGAKLLPVRVKANVAPEGCDTWREAFRVVQAKEVWETFGAFITQAKPKLGPGIKERMDFAASVTDEQANRSRETVAAARTQIRATLPP